MNKFVITKIEMPANKSNNLELIQRLYDFGFCPGLEVQVIGRVSFNSVIIVQYDTTRIALNEEEFSCLHGRS